MNNTLQRIGKYELQKSLGQGSFGEVWKCYDHQHHIEVALKIFHSDLQSDPHFMKRFLAEGQAIVDLHHRNIVQAREVYITRPTEAQRTIAYIAMDYISGPSLADYIRGTSRIGRFPDVNDILFIFTRIGRAVDYAHQQGIVHGNIKPSNVLLNRQGVQERPLGEPMLTDFGFARITGETASASTAFYTSPEQAKGLVPDTRSDIYALGIILYEICTGVQPFRSESPVAVMMQHINTLPTPPILINPNVPTELSEVILRSISKDPTLRYSSAAQLVAALANACSMPIILNNAPTLHEPRSEASLGRMRTILGVSQPLADISQQLPGVSQPLSPISQELSGISRSMPAVASQKLPTPVSGDKTTRVIPAITITGELRTVEQSTALIAIPGQSIGGESKPGRRISRTYIIVASILIFLILVGVVGSLALIRPTITPVVVATSGSIAFGSDAAGQNDIVHLELQHIPNAPSGMNYWAWLIGQGNTPPLSLGELAVNGAAVHFTYAGDSQHDDLLAFASQALITEEEGTATPFQPSNKVVYAVTLAQTPISGDPDHLSLLEHLRHLLSGAPNPPGNSMEAAGGLNTLLERNTAKLWLWVGNAHDYWNGSFKDRNNIYFIHSQLTHAIDVIEGKNLDSHDGLVARLGLLKQPMGTPVITHMLTHLSAIATAPDATDSQKNLAKQDIQELQQIAEELQKVDNDAQKLNGMDNRTITSQQALVVLDDLENTANLLYNGQIDSATNQVIQKGVVQLHSDIQSLAAFSINPVKR